MDKAQQPLRRLGMDAKNNTQSERRLLTESEAARQLQVCAKTLYHARKRGDLRYVRLGQCVRYDPRDLDDFIDQQKQQTGGNRIVTGVSESR